MPGIPLETAKCDDLVLRKLVDMEAIWQVSKGLGPLGAT